MIQRLFTSERFPKEVQLFVDSAQWRGARSYARTWPHEYLVRTPENALMMLNLAFHVFEHGIPGRFYKRRQQHFYQDGKMYWLMDPPEKVTIVNRCDEDQTYEARLAAGTLPEQQNILADEAKPGYRVGMKRGPHGS